MDEQISVSMIEDAVSKYRKTMKDAESFSVDDVVSFVMKSGCIPAPERKERVIRDVELILESCDDVFYSSNNCDPLCRNKALFFKGTKFKILPTKLEIKDGILLYGARFAPFCSEDIFADEYVLTAERSQTKLPVVAYSAQLGQIARCFMLLGRSGMIDCVVAESTANYQALKRASSPEMAMVTLSAFDLSAFYKENHFSEGDAIIATVQDWRSGCFSLEYRGKDELADSAAMREFLSAFEEGIIQTCEDYGEYLDIPGQISHAYLCAFLAGHDLRRKPYVALDEYPSMMRDIAIRRDDADWVLVPMDELASGDVQEPAERSAHAEEAEHVHECCGHDHEPSEEQGGKVVKTEDLSVSAGKLDSIDAILEEINAPVSYIEIYALIMNDLANGQDLFSSFYGSLLELMNVSFVDEAQEVAFQNYVEDAWESAFEQFNPVIEEAKTPLRTRLLEVNEQRIEYSRSLLERYQGKEIPPETVQQMKHIHGQILNTLALLNRDAGLPEGEEYEMLELRVGDIADAWDDFAEAQDRNRK